MSARQRSIPALLGLIAFTVLGALAEPNFWAQWWFWVGVAFTLSVVFVEAFFTRAQDAIINGVGAIAAFWSADRLALSELWQLYLFVSAVVLCSGLVAALSREGRAKVLSNWAATHVGRAALLYPVVLLLQAAQKIVISNESNYLWLAVGVLVLLFVLSMDWEKLSQPDAALLSKAIGASSPNLLLIEGLPDGVTVGQALNLQAGDVNHEGHLVAVLPGSTTARGLVALPTDWRKVSPSFPSELRVTQSRTSKVAIAGLAAAGTDTISIEFDAIGELAIGEPLWVQTKNGERTIYQVSDVRLLTVSRAGGDSLVTHCTARHIGVEADGWLRQRPGLPAPHTVVERPHKLMTSSLPPEFHRIGVLKGTGIPVGIADEGARRGHVAVLGMSGMGKTSLVQHLCNQLGRSRQVVAFDVTGEYKQRLAFPAWTPADFVTKGHQVFEPGKLPSRRGAEVIEQFMGAANQDYQDGAVVPRVIVLEEAHSFVPEWNFALQNQKDDVANTTRMMMHARKYGLSFVLISQRTAVVSKSALSQCESYVVFRVVDDTSLSYIEEMAGTVVRALVPSLQRYEALCFGPAFNAEAPVVVVLDAPTT